MNEQKALRVLRAHNRWRRNDGPYRHSPAVVGEAIDVACRVLVEHREAIKVLQQIAEGDNRTRRKKLASAFLGFLESLRTGA